jgi:hypothetical protein
MRRGHGFGMAGALALALGLGFGGAAWAEDAPIVEKLEKGEINWTKKTVLATGSGAPDLKLPNVAAVRLNAERAAKLDAYRNILEAVKGVRLRGGSTAAAPLESAQIRTQVEGVIQGCKTVDTRYYSDGGVEVVVRCPLDGGISAILVPSQGERKELPSSGESKFTGLVVDASGSMSPPTLAPRLVDASGALLYGAEHVRPSALREVGVASYARSVEAAGRDPRAGTNPLVLKATAGAVPGELVLIAEEAARLKSGNAGFLADGKVVIVTDGP